MVWVPPPQGPYSHDIWAPEIHFLHNKGPLSFFRRGKWYIYFAADAGANQTHRNWVVENSSSDPLQGKWKFKGKVTDSSDRWAIDPSLLEDKGKLYLIWSGWEGADDGTQGIYIARLKNPWTVESPRVRISTPQYSWEEVGDIVSNKPPNSSRHVSVNEGPEILKRANKIFLIYFRQRLLDRFL